MKNNKNLNQYLFTGPENTNRNQNFNNINIISLNNSKLYEQNCDMFINTEISNNNHNVSFCTKAGDKHEKFDYSANKINTDVYDIYNETTSTNHKLYFDNGNYTDVNIKNKIMNINASLKSFNIHVKNKFINYSDFENSKNKNSYINSLLEYIVDLIWIIKTERDAKIELVRKLQSSNFKFDEYEKKVKKLNNELSDTKKYLNNALNKNFFGKEKYNNNSKNSSLNNLINKNYGFSSGKNSNNNNNINSNNIEGEFALLKAENKKLNSQLNILKNDTKKKELEFSKLQEKVKKLLNDKITIQPSSSSGLNNSFSNNNYNINPIGTIRKASNNNNFSCRNNRNLPNDIFKISTFIGFDPNNNNNNLENSVKHNSRNSNNRNFNNLENIYKKFLEFNTQNNIVKKYESLLNQNKTLFGVMFNLQESLDKIYQKIIYFNKDNTKIKTELMDLIKLKENIFSLHLIDKELLSEFSDNFSENIKLFEDILLRMIEFIYFENSEWKGKYYKLEKEFGKNKPTLISNHVDCSINSNENESINKDSNYIDNFKNPSENEKHNNNSRNNRNEKDIIKNLKRWSMRAMLNTPGLGKNNPSFSIKKDSFAGRIFYENKIIIGKFDDYENESNKVENDNKFSMIMNKDQSVKSMKFAGDDFNLK